MFLSFGEFAHERRLVRGLRGRTLERSCLEALVAVLTSHERRERLPWGLLWKMHVQADKALAKLGPNDPCYPLLREIRRGALWEVQSRELRGL
jgi:hypothetical protein